MCDRGVNIFSSRNQSISLINLEEIFIIIIFSLFHVNVRKKSNIYDGSYICMRKRELIVNKIKEVGVLQ
jgi:hypothetical protein